MIRNFNYYISILFFIICANNLFGEEYFLHPENYDPYYGKSDKIYLTKYWKFNPAVNLYKQFSAKKEHQNDPGNDIGLKNKYYLPEYDDSSWKKFPVPYVWNVSFPYNIKCMKNKFAGIGYYRTTFMVPQNWQGKKFYLSCDLIQSDCRIWINGKEAGTFSSMEKSSGPWYAFQSRCWLDFFSMDVSDFIKPGSKNFITIRMFDDGIPYFHKVVADDGGLIGPVYIEARNPIFTERILVNGNPVNSSLEFKALINNTTGKAASLKLSAQMLPFESAYYKPPKPGVAQTSFELGLINLKPGINEISRKIKVDNPETWSHASPFLYTFNLQNDGKLLGRTRFGFRRFSTSGKNFMLNGKPVRVLSINPDSQFAYLTRIQMYNYRNWLRLGLGLLKKMNINFTRVHNGPESKVFYDLCDELGIITEDDFSPQKRMLAHDKAERIEMLAEIKVGKYFDKNGEFNPEIKATLEKWIYMLHNHPSVCMLTAGNELGLHKKGAATKPINDYINGFYNFVKRHDLQKRLITSSSGFSAWTWPKYYKPLSDYYDFHSYADGSQGWSDFVQGNYGLCKYFKSIYGSINKPIINGEVSFLVVSNQLIPKDISRLMKNGHLDIPAYVSWANKKNSKTKANNWVDWAAQAWYVRWAGIRSAANVKNNTPAFDRLINATIRSFRRDMDFLQGFAIHSISPRQLGFLPLAEFSKFSSEYLSNLQIKLIKSPRFKAIKNAYSPFIATVGLINRNLFSGDTMSTNMTVVNDLYGNAVDNAVMVLTFKNKSGQKFELGKFSIPHVESGRKIVKRISYKIPANTRSGSAVLMVSALIDGKKVYSYDIPMFVMSAKDRKRKISCKQKIALYSIPRSKSTEQVLKGFGIKYTKLKEFSSLDSFQTLIIGCNSFDGELIRSGQKIRNWLEKGGNIICFEQAACDSIPFLKEFKIKYSGDMSFADVINTSSPLVKDMQPLNFELWNGRRYKNNDGVLRANNKKLYNAFVQPLTRGVIISGGALTGWKWYCNIPYGMLVVGNKVKKGTVFFSQLHAIGRFQKDSAATQYLYNLLNSVLVKKIQVPAL